MSDRHGSVSGRGEESRGRLRDLSIRELEVLSLLVKGKSDFAIALALAISPREVEMHVADILGTLGLESRASVALFWTEAMRESKDVSDSEE